MGRQACSPASLLKYPTQRLLYPDNDNAIISDALSAMPDGLHQMHGSPLVAICSHDGPSPMHPVQPMRRAWTGWECHFSQGANFLPKSQACDGRGHAAVYALTRSSLIGPASLLVRLSRLPTWAL